MASEQEPTPIPPRTDPEVSQSPITLYANYGLRYDPATGKFYDPNELGPPISISIGGTADAEDTENVNINRPIIIPQPPITNPSSNDSYVPSFADTQRDIRNTIAPATNQPLAETASGPISTTGTGFINGGYGSVSATQNAAAASEAAQRARETGLTPPAQQQRIVTDSADSGPVNSNNSRYRTYAETQGDVLNAIKSPGAGTSINEPRSANSARDIQAEKTTARTQNAAQQVSTFKQNPDWRVRLSLAPGATYLYEDNDAKSILAPLRVTNGVIFPYTPTISVNYHATYDSQEIVHSNYRLQMYKGSYVDNISITGDFTAQDTNEANYLLAVIHFFRSATKMFYGQDQNPKNGVPPPLLYLSGFGTYQFDNHPLVIQNFAYSLPNEVDYIRATTQPVNFQLQQQPKVQTANKSNLFDSVLNRLLGKNVQPGGITPPPNFSSLGNTANGEVTYVPTKIQLSLTCIPIVTRNDISNNFSLREYASGKLLRGSVRTSSGIGSGGMW